MGCVYSEGQLCQKEVIHDVEKLRKLDTLVVNYMKTNNVINDCEKLSINAMKSQAFTSEYKCSSSMQMRPENFDEEKSEKIIDNLILNENIQRVEINRVNSLEKEIFRKRQKGILLQKRNLSIFGEKMLTEFNLARTNPAAYADKLENLIKFIKPNKDKKNQNREGYTYVLEYSNKKNIGLSTGEKSFRKAIDLLRNLDPVDSLEWEDEIFIDIQTEHLSNIENVIKEKTNKMKEKFPMLKMHMDMIRDPELSAILQIVDDTVFNGKRRDAILNQNFNFMSLSQAKDENKQIYTLISFA